MLVSALELLEAEKGPVLTDFPEDAPPTSQDAGPVACPVDFSPAPEEMSDTERLLSAFRREAAQLQSWYDLAVEKRGRTTFSGSFATPEKTAAFIAEAARGGQPDSGDPSRSFAVALRLAVADLKAYYQEAVSAQPGQPTDSTSLDNWFWGETVAAWVINTLKGICLASSDKEIRLLGKLLLVPRTQAHRFKT